MRGSTLKVVERGTTYLIDDPKLDGGLKASVSVAEEATTAQGVRTYRTLHCDRINLDRAKEREAFAEKAGTDGADLLEVRRRVLDFITPLTSPPDEPPEPVDPEIVKQATTLLAAPDLLATFGEAIRASGYAGDLHNPKLLYLALTSRVTRRPINVLVGGPSSAGKNFVVDRVVEFFPAAAVYVMGAMSSMAPVYTDADLQHRHLVISEAAAIHRDGTGTLIMRGLIWGNQFEYEVTEQGPDGVFGTRRITKPGPTGLVTTSVKGIEEELNTRLLTLTVPDDEGATRDILAITGKRAAGEGAAAPDLRVWHEVQRWIAEEGAHEVVIKFASNLAALFPAKLIRARRDFPQLLALIAASAILHQQQRERDDQGRIVADEMDYRIVYDLAAPVFGAAASEGVTPAVRQTVAKVAELTKGSENDTISAHALGDALGISRSALSYRLKPAFKGGFLVNEERTRGKPYKLRVGAPLPDDATLPAPERVFGAPVPPATVRTVEHPSENRRDSWEMPVRAGELNRRPVQFEHPGHSNGADEHPNVRNGAEIQEVFESSNGIAGEGWAAHIDAQQRDDLLGASGGDGARERVVNAEPNDLATTTAWQEARAPGPGDAGQAEDAPGEQALAPGDDPWATATPVRL